MTLAKVIYASMTGNTEGAADILVDALKADGVDVEKSECTEVSASDFQDADICVVATYTWGDGDLPDEIMDFHEELQDIDLSGKVFGVIGTGDTSYEYYCKSADDFVDAFKKTGATQGADTVRIENDAEDEDEEALKAFAKSLVAAV